MKKFFLVFIGVISAVIQGGILIFLIMTPSIIKNNSTDGILLKNDLYKLLEEFEYKSRNIGKEIIIYNGVTIDEGTKSNNDIDNKAIQLTEGISSEREKARALYEWIGSNIEYDNEKAEVVLDDSDRSKMPESGAICAFETRKGICFDKACLYVAMARAVDLKVRLVSGEAYDGEQYVGHAWNQVYLQHENIWINVDPTFYSAGNYFDSNLFNQHKIENIAGEW
ncbi:transglutaminase family protein [uncultured Clostridium sp.]|uniref:transglutaminase-like domain-containing protein n=1 Tax=uncultured Clostridium sp. TaxID=59620 RepID=UPI0026010E3D|nr:transglutaminase-like domain-containing protein [uncultured Clostridium sp.]